MGPSYRAACAAADAYTARLNRDETFFPYNTWPSAGLVLEYEQPLRAPPYWATRTS